MAVLGCYHMGWLPTAWDCTSCSFHTVSSPHICSAGVPCAVFAPWKVLAQRVRWFGEELPGVSRWRGTGGRTRASCYEMHQTQRRVDGGTEIRRQAPMSRCWPAAGVQLTGPVASGLTLGSQRSARSFPRDALGVRHAAGSPRGLPGGRAGAYSRSLLFRPARTALHSLGLVSYGMSECVEGE